jgi:GMP synthase-like glutamine amidotransferase
MITILQHGEHEGPGTIAEYLQDRRLAYEILRLYEGDEVPGDLPDNLIILGGQMSVNDTVEYPHFTREKTLAAAMIRENRPVLGICLGAQMIASAFGERVRKGTSETGWYSLKGCIPEWYSLFPQSFPVFQWHEETFNLPGGATLLVQGDAVKNQAFRLGSAVGVQFHPEVTMEIISSWVKDLPGAERNRVIQESGQDLVENEKRCCALIDAFTRGWVL